MEITRSKYFNNIIILAADDGYHFEDMFGNKWFNAVYVFNEDDIRKYKEVKNG